MNPYSPLYQNLIDQVIVCLVIILAIAIGLWATRRKYPSAISSERCLLSVLRVLLSVFAGIGGIFLVGLVFLVWLEISSGFWFLWQLLFLASVAAVFWVAPLLGVVLMIWALFGWRKLCFSAGAIVLSGCWFGILAADALLYFAIVISVVTKSGA